MSAAPVPRCFLALALMLSSHSCLGEALQLQPGLLLNAAGATLKLEAHAIPCATDWNGDGRKDLLVGYRYADKIALFVNAGSDAAPVFNAPFNLPAGGSDIQHPSSGCGAPAPFVCDFDADGKRDLLVGTGSEGYVYFYRNTNTDSSPLLAPGARLMVGSSPLAVPARATPFFCDWDGDSLADLLCGDGNGTVSFFKNIGSPQAPAFAPALPVQAGGVALNLGARSIIRMCDWNGDGTRDLVGSSSTGVYCCANTSAQGNPVLLPPVQISAPLVPGGLFPINTGYRMRLELVDWENDGTTDILVGNADGTISYYQGYTFGLNLSFAPQTTDCILRWHSAPLLRYHVLTGSSPASLNQCAVSNLPSAGRTTSWTNSAPSTAAFYRVQIAP